ncbi:MAG TPA: hypothetical protein VE289_07675 [Gaiellaceae bacterium]|nr:hypothetical protein [Gaiellaceae bacterium]
MPGDDPHARTRQAKGRRQELLELRVRASALGLRGDSHLPAVAVAARDLAATRAGGETDPDPAHY